MTTVILLDAPVAVRQALRARLSLEPGLAIVGEAESAAAAISLAETLDPDVVLVDAETPFLDVPTVVRALKHQDRDRGVVVITQHSASLNYELNGTCAVITGKHEKPDSLVHAIESASRRTCEA